MPPRPQPLSTPPLPPAVYLILLALTDGAAHGYDIRKSVIDRSSDAIRLDPGSLYRLVARLFDEKLIAEAASPKDADRDDERRRYYRLTSLGRRVLDAETDRMADLVAQARGRRAARAAR